MGFCLFDWLGGLEANRNEIEIPATRNQPRFERWRASLTSKLPMGGKSKRAKMPAEAQEPSIPTKEPKRSATTVMTAKKTRGKYALEAESLNTRLVSQAAEQHSSNPRTGSQRRHENM